VLAAGESRRFGGIKQLHPIDGRPMLELVLAAVERARIGTRVVVLGANADRIRRAVPTHGSQVIVCPAWRDGQAASLACALAALPANIEQALVVLGDWPRLDPAAIARVCAGSGVRAADYGAGRSHPVVLPRSVWSRLPSTGETPGRGLDATLVDCRDLPAPGDVDYAPT